VANKMLATVLSLSLKVSAVICWPKKKKKKKKLKNRVNTQDFYYIAT
jgi:hypothetical protein